MTSEDNYFVDLITHNYSQYLNKDQLSRVKKSLTQLIEDASTIRNFPLTHEDAPTPLFSNLAEIPPKQSDRN